MPSYGWRPTVRPSWGFAGSSIPFRHKGEYIAKGRRLIPIAEVLRLWLQGLTAREICDELGEVRGAKFTPIAISGAINRERKFGNSALFPLRRLVDDDEPDYGIDEDTARRLGL